MRSGTTGMVIDRQKVLRNSRVRKHRMRSERTLSARGREREITARDESEMKFLCETEDGGEITTLR